MGTQTTRHEDFKQRSGLKRNLKRNVRQQRKNYFVQDGQEMH